MARDKIEKRQRNSNKKTARKEGKPKGRKKSIITDKIVKNQKGKKGRKQNKIQIRKYKLDINLEAKINRQQQCLTKSTNDSGIFQFARNASVALTHFQRAKREQKP